LRRREDAKNGVSTPECHCLVAFSVSGAGKTVNTYGRAGSACILFVGADSLSGRAWDNLLENKVLYPLPRSLAW
jgi:hypothetical protein